MLLRHTPSNEHLRHKSQTWCETCVWQHWTRPAVCATNFPKIYVRNGTKRKATYANLLELESKTVDPLLIWMGWRIKHTLWCQQFRLWTIKSLKIKRNKGKSFAWEGERKERERNFCTKQRDNVSSRLHRFERVNRERKREKRILLATLIKLLHKQPTLNVLSLVAEVGRANISLRISEKRKISVIEIPIKFCEMGEWIKSSGKLNRVIYTSGRKVRT